MSVFLKELQDIVDKAKDKSKVKNINNKGGAISLENAWKELQPKNIYQGRKSSPLKEEGKSALLSLYQPLIGGEALSLYLTLYQKSR